MGIGQIQEVSSVEVEKRDVCEYNRTSIFHKSPLPTKQWHRGQWVNMFYLDCLEPQNQRSSILLVVTKSILF